MLWKSQDICQWWNELITRFSHKEANMTLTRASITLIHVVNLCIWPGQIPSGNAICPTCSNKYCGNLVKLNIQADVREMENFCLKTSMMWTTRSWRAAVFTCAVLHSFSNVSWGAWNLHSEKSPSYSLLRATCCFYAFGTRRFAFLARSSSALSDAAISHTTARRVLYRWSPLDFQFAVLWLFQAAAEL